MADAILHHCVQCGREIPRRTKNGKPRYCSDECRLWAFVKKGAESECWPYAGCKSPRMGYGLSHRKGKTTPAHRIAYEAAHGEIPAGMFVCHKCDNPPCCNPAHLFLGTPQDNVDDMMAKGRQRKTAEAVDKFLSLRKTPEFEEKRRQSSVGRSWKLSEETKQRMVERSKATKERNRLARTQESAEGK